MAALHRSLPPPPAFTPASTAMKVHHHLARGFWDVDDHHDHQSPSLSLSCKRLRPLAPKLSDSSATTAAAAFDLKSFIRPDSGPRKLAPTTTSDPNAAQPQVDSQPGGTRWNPTQEQIGILEMLYCKGMRTPNAQQIDHITLQLSKYGKIEGKNVFYWFQNHKARERQKQKRTTTLTLLSPDHASTPPTSSTTTSFLSSITFSFDNSPSKEELRRDEQVANKRKSRSWGFEGLAIGDGSKSETNDHEEEGVKRTLELFPLHPEGR